MEWVIALVGMALTGVMSFWMGVRRERGRHARWADVQKALQEDRRQQGGVVLKRLRITR